MDRNTLKTITLKGYKSFRDAEVHFSDVTVLLGANGAGKSNLVSFFRMLNFISTGAMQDYIGRGAGGSSIRSSSPTHRFSRCPGGAMA